LRAFDGVPEVGLIDIEFRPASRALDDGHFDFQKRGDGVAL
jgi:hypothetical protein